MTGPRMMLSLYREAWESHVDLCTDCCWIDLHLCHVGQKLRDAWMQACVAALAPPPNIHRSPVKA
jgi:hypothetical protein